MARTRKGTPPSYCLHKASGRARVVIRGKTIWLGKYGSPESQDEYAAVVAAWKADPNNVLTIKPTEDLSVAELVASYTRHIEGYYKKDGKQTSEVCAIKSAIKIVRQMYGDLRVTEFGPLRLRKVIEAMVKKGWSRRSINRQICRVRALFKYGVGRELVPESILTALKAVEGLKSGRETDDGQTPQERARIRSVDDATVEATKKYLPEVLQDMVRLQRITAMRPAEVCIVRPCDVDRTDPKTWIYRPEHHKCEHHEDMGRAVPIGAQAQEILKPYLDRMPMAYCFNPQEAMKQRWAECEKHRRPDQKKDEPATDRVIRDHYGPASYRRAIRRAADAANQEAIEEAEKSGLKVTGRLVKRWHPNQLRHARATELAQQFGKHDAATMLGHKKPGTVENYIDEMTRRACEIAAMVG